MMNILFVLENNKLTRITKTIVSRLYGNKHDRFLNTRNAVFSLLFNNYIEHFNMDITMFLQLFTSRTMT